MMWQNVSTSQESQSMRHITLSGGQIFLISEENLILLTSPVILGNGAIVSLDGQIRYPDGSRRVLTDGEFI